MTDTIKPILKAVSSGELTPKEGLAKALKTSTRLGDVVPKFTSESLLCDFPSIEKYQYLLKDESNLVVMAARPGNGKTALACQIALNVSRHSKVLLFSLEMRKEALYKRLLSVVSQIPIKNLGMSIHTNSVLKATNELSKHNMDIIDDQNMSALDIVKAVLDENRVSKIDLVVIDYAGMIKVNQAYRHTEISSAMTMIKQRICDDLKIPVLMLAQMNRGFDDRYSQYMLNVEKSKLYPNAEERVVSEIRPTMADLAESSGLEHRADVVMFLHRPSLLDKTKPRDAFKVYVDKNRNGVVRDFDLRFSDSLTKFFDHNAEIEDDL